MAHGHSSTNQAETSEDLGQEGDDSVNPDVTWDFSDWDDAIQGDLGAALLRNKIPHRWEGATLSTEPDYENRVDSILDEFCGLSDQDLSEAEIESGDDDNGEDDDEVTWETPGWTSDTRGEFTATLLAADVPHYWDGTTLITDAEYEDRVDSIMDDLFGSLAEDGSPGNRFEANRSESDFLVEGGDRKTSSGLIAGVLITVVLLLAAGGAGVIIAHHHSGSASASAGAGVPSDSTGGGQQVPTTSTAPVSIQLRQAYQAGYATGSGAAFFNVNSESEACQFSSESYAQRSNSIYSALVTQYYAGCVDGYQENPATNG